MSVPSAAHFVSLAVLALASCASSPAPGHTPPAGSKFAITDGGELGSAAHGDEVQKSSYCAGCHPAIYAEHEANTHGTAFLDPETRLATHNFRREDCVRCHTPRPVFETGIGLTPMQRWTNLEEGNTCMSCHWKKDYDYTQFTGGAQCKSAFDPRVGEVQACASCHRIAGTPEQWSRAEHGKQAGNVCIDCHMPLVDRPVAVGEKPRPVHSHVFPASHSEKQLRRAYGWNVAIEGSELVVTITNKGVGHNFPTASRQRALESLVTVRDADGNVLGSSRMSCNYPYASELEPGQLTLPTSTQIPSGKSREHRVPLTVANGTVEVSLFFKTYRPSTDTDPDLSTLLETQTLPFSDIVPSSEAIADPPRKGGQPPAASVEEFFDPAGLCNTARPEPGSGPIQPPEGKTHAERLKLVSMLESHLPEVRRLAHARLLQLGLEAVPELVTGIGAWSNETFNQAQTILTEIGTPALAGLREALHDEQLYRRGNARSVIARIGLDASQSELLHELEGDLAAQEPLDRRSAAEALGVLHDAAAAPALAKLLSDADPDVVIAAARALAQLDVRSALPQLRVALERASAFESRMELATAVCELGDRAGVEVLLRELSQPDVALREAAFERLFAVTGIFCGFDPDAPAPLRLEALARLQAFWSAKRDTVVLRRRAELDPLVREHTLDLVLALGEGSDTVAPGDNPRIFAELVQLGQQAVPALLDALTFPEGYWQKRQLACEALGRIGSKDAAPFVAGALRDQAVPVCEAACTALSSIGDPAALPQLREYERHVRGWRADPVRGQAVERLLAGAARTRLALGDASAHSQLVSALFSPDRAAREIAIEALAASGDRRGYDPDATPAERDAAAARWNS
ncbi:MAG: HEAT repeat domain-containing protein [Planctomycetes bacterium]|nr:HEAT repeat domain-containing protein [Planctomycetota bacterium]